MATTTRDWRRNRDMWVRVLEKQTNEGVDVWNARIRKRSFATERALRGWLSAQGVTGYAQSLVSPRRTFARVLPTTKTRVDLGLRLDHRLPSGRLQRSNIHETMRLQVSLAAPSDVDAEVEKWLRQAYVDNS